MLREALAFPRGREGATRDLVVGGLLVFTSVLVFPALMVAGYLLQVMAVGARGRDRLPTFDSLGRLLLDGLRAVVVVFTYGVFPLVLLVGGVAITAFVAIPEPALVELQQGAFRAAVPMVTHEQLALVGGVAFLLVLAVAVLVLHLPAALVALGTQGRLDAAFQTQALWAVVNTTAYLKGLVLALVVAAVGMAVAVPLSVVLVGFFLQFYVLVVAAFVLGRSVGGAAITAIEPRRERERRAAAGNA